MTDNYINAKDLELEVSHYLLCEKESETITLEELNEIVSRFPTADIVKVVHCKDCKHFVKDTCLLFQGLTVPAPTDYCCYAERRKSDDEKQD